MARFKIGDSVIDNVQVQSEAEKRANRTAVFRDCNGDTARLAGYTYGELLQLFRNTYEKLEHQLEPELKTFLMAMITSTKNYIDGK